MKKTGNQKFSFGRNVGAFASATMISRLLGFARDSAVAAFFGGGGATDAFYAAFKIPNLLRRFLGEGSLTAAFVPVFSDTLHKKGPEEARELFNALLSGLTVILIILVALGMVFAPQITYLSSWGFARDPEKFDLTVRLTRLIFPFLLLISLAAVVTSVLNACGRFFTPAVAPAGLSIGEIAFIVFVASRMDSPVEGLAVAAVIGVGIHLLWLLPSLYKEGYRIRFVRPFRHPEVYRVILLMIPTMIGLCADQMNSFVDQVCASLLREGSVTALYNSSRVMQLPLALFGVAVASVSLPALSKASSEGDMDGFKNQLSLAIRIANFVLIPSFIGLAVLGFPIVQVLFERGRFTVEASRLAYAALVPMAAGLPAYSMIKIFASGFYARQNTRTPVRLAFIGMLINVVLDVVLMYPFGVAGLTTATTVSAWVQAALLFHYLRKDVGAIGGRDFAMSFFYGSLAGLGMGIVCWALAFHALAATSVYLRVFVSIGTGGAFYFLIARLMKVRELDFFMAAVRRKTARV